MVQQAPVRLAPAVYALLHISDYKIGEALGDAVVKQRAEIFPLDLGGILELVQEEMLISYSCLFIDERSFGIVYYLPERVIGLVYGHYVLLLKNLTKMAVQVVSHSKSIDLAPEGKGRVKNLETGIEHINKPFHRRYHSGGDHIFKTGILFREPS